MKKTMSIKERVEEKTKDCRTIDECLATLNQKEQLFFIDEQIRIKNTNAHIVSLLGRRLLAEEILKDIQDLQKKKEKLNK